jgi:hypothetical protein
MSHTLLWSQVPVSIQLWDGSFYLLVLQSAICIVQDIGNWYHIGQVAIRDNIGELADKPVNRLFGDPPSSD